MTNSMGPPPPKSPNSSAKPEIKPVDELASPSISPSSPAAEATTTVGSAATSMPSTPRNPQASKSDSPGSTIGVAEGQPPRDSTNIFAAESLEKIPENSSSDVNAKPQTPKPPSQGVAVPYKIPPWSGAPCHEFYLEVLKDGSIIDKLNVYEKGAYMFGRLDLCDFVLEHPTISRFHAVIQFKRSGHAYLYDLGSTHGTFLNKNQVEKNTYVDLHVGDIIRFGRSSRLFILQGPSELMPPETIVKLMREVKMREAMLDKETSLQRARLEASLADGISWGMGEDAIEEDEDVADEVTWQSYKGPLTEKQEKTREKIIKRMEKIANMKKEINAIRVKDISQGGLTQGQQTQIARNEQRTTQIMEELESLEETLNDSIRESLGARTGKISNGKKNGSMEDEEEYLSDDDEFYDRTKRKPSRQKPGDIQSIETADTLLTKREAITKEMNDMKELLIIEKNKMASESAIQDEMGDTLDAYMSGLSSQLVHDKSKQLEEELSSLQSELDRICYLLKIADPTGEAAKKRELKLQEPKPNKSEEVAPSIKKKPPAETQKSSEPCAKADNKEPPLETQEISKACGKADGSIQGEKHADVTVNLEKSEPGCERLEAENVVYTVPKPQWLGAVEERVKDDTQHLMAPLHDTDESHQFVDYKNRNEILGIVDDAKTSAKSNIESAAPGLILRKRKQVETSGMNSDDASQQLTSSSTGELMAQDAVALLLKHKRGLNATDDEGRFGSQDDTNNTIDDKRKPKRVLGPEKPSFLSNEMDYNTWVPPEGQSGDGRTSLNDKYGY